jgi:hypothetical protein
MVKEERLEQLRTVFRNCVKSIIGEIKNKDVNIDDADNIERYAGLVANQLVYDVKIRIDNK